MHCIKEVAFRIRITHFTTALSRQLRMVNCVIAAVTWSSVLTNHRRSAFFIPHFTLRITQFRILPIAIRLFVAPTGAPWTALA